MSQDNFLNIALDSLLCNFPHVLYEKIEGECLEVSDEEVCVLLVDSRISYSEVEKKITLIKSLGGLVNTLILRMNSPIFFSFGYGKHLIIDMMDSLNVCVKNILHYIDSNKGNVATVVKVKNIITRHDLHIMSMLKHNVDISIIAAITGVSVKRIYFYREQLYRRLEFKNYHQACIFVFQNKLLNIQDA